MYSSFFKKGTIYLSLSLSVLWFQLSGDYLVNETFPYTLYVQLSGDYLVNETFPYTLYDALKEKKPQFLYTLDLIL